MQRRELLVAAGTVVATGLAGCSEIAGGDGNTADGTATPTNTPGQDDPTATTGKQGRSRVVTVSGEGEVTGDPDRAILELNVEARGDSAAAVRNDLASRAETVRQAVLDTGVDEDNVTTQQFRINERIDRRRLREADVDPNSPEARERFRFYSGTNSFRVEIDDIDRVGSVIDAAVDAGADEVDRVTFTLSEEKRTDLREEALRKAVSSARAKADAIADEVDGDIVEATVVDASRGRIGPVERSADAAAMATPAPEPTPTAPGTGVQPGDVTVTVDVDVRYTME